MPGSTSPASEPAASQSVTLGDGPIERLAQRCHQGEIELATAREMAKRPAVVISLTPTYAAAFAEWVARMAGHGQREAATLLSTLLLDASEQLLDDEAGLAIKQAADYAFLNIAAGRFSKTRIGGRMLRRAPSANGCCGGPRPRGTTTSCP